MADTTKVALRRPRFKLYSFDEVCRMPPAQWEEECRLNNADMERSPEDEQPYPSHLGKKEIRS
jgi:hypothetical protein